MRQRSTVFADYEQFYVQDAVAHTAAMRAGAATDPDRVAGGWTDDAVHIHRIGMEPYSISVGTARRDFVEVVVQVHDTAPSLNAAAEHVVEADLEVTTGALSVVGCAEPVKPEDTLQIRSGLYRVRVSYLSAEPVPTADPELDGDHFMYLIELWPSRDSEQVAVLIQGPNPW